MIDQRWAVGSVGRTYTPVCDGCGDELEPEFDFEDAVEAMHDAGWDSVRDRDGWSNYCPQCALLMGAGTDFRGL